MNLKIKTIILPLTLILLLTTIGCQRKSNIVQGEWILENKAKDTHEGVQIAPNGLAASINQPTIQYTHWTLHKKN